MTWVPAGIIWYDRGIYNIVNEEEFKIKYAVKILNFRFRNICSQDEMAGRERKETQNREWELKEIETKNVITFFVCSVCVCLCLFVFYKEFKLFNVLFIFCVCVCV